MHMGAVLGLRDPYIVAVVILCLASAVLCLIYGLVMWNRGEEAVKQEDIQWAAEEEKVEDKL